MEHKELFTAMSKFQAEILNIPKDAKNPFFNSKYASLENVLNEVRPLLSKHGLSVIQTSDIKEGKTGIVTYLCHSSGQSMSGFMPIYPKDSSAQAVGSAITYARRYALMAVCGVAGEDDDGNGASKPTQHPEPRSFNPQTPAPLHPAQAIAEQMAEKMSQETKVANPGDYICEFGKYRGKRIRDIELKELDGYCMYIQESSAAKGEQPSGKAREFILNAQKYLNSRRGQDIDGPDYEEDIPQ